ncbi:MAG: thioesterase family protein [Hyphomicrobiaceae bacterium]|nr:thioesterase family protein [Hyphomicrobiaceae bacterium]
MNLWLRLFWYFITAWRRPTIAMPDGVSQLSFRVLPTDLDTSAHMNNGRYLALMDLGRLDILVSTGLLRAALRHKWTPVATAIKIRFRRELRLFQRFHILTRIVAWDEQTVVMEQQFIMSGGTRDGQLAAQALFKGGLYDRAAKRFVPIATLMRETGQDGESPAPSPEVAAFLKADDEMKRAAQRRVD